ncbi:MAG: photosystem reaction center subunit H [Proteobacteria bacterium]|nr:MAG: photosystem reaction center subunit H [Pseudomonadota bacterium]
MLRRLWSLDHLPIGANDGEIGRVVDMHFDDCQWRVRYLVVRTGGWLGGRRVLIPIQAVYGVEEHAGRIDVDLTRAQVRDSPVVDVDGSLSRPQEQAYFDHYGYSYYWTEPQVFGAASLSAGAALPERDPLGVQARERPPEGEPNDSPLHSAKAVSRYPVQATDGAAGHIEDFMLDRTSWALRYVVVDTRKWLPGGHVLVPIERVRRLSRAERAAYVDLSRAAIHDSPPAHEIARVSDYEAQLGRRPGRHPEP